MVNIPPSRRVCILYFGIPACYYFSLSIKLLKYNFYAVIDQYLFGCVARRQVTNTFLRQTLVSAVLKREPVGGKHYKVSVPALVHTT